MSSANHKSWFARNWLWALPAGCLLPVVVGVISVGLIIFLSVSSLKSSDAYSLAMEKLRAQPEVVRQLGTPIESGWELHGHVQVREGKGSANLQIPLEGPEGEGSAKARAKMEQGKWSLTFLSFRPKGQEKPLVIVEPPADVAPEKTPEEKDTQAKDTRTPETSSDKNSTEDNPAKENKN